MWVQDLVEALSDATAWNTPKKKDQVRASSGRTAASCICALHGHRLISHYLPQHCECPQSAALLAVMSICISVCSFP